MKAEFKFNLDDPKDVMRHKVMLQAPDLMSCLTDIAAYLRRKIKYEPLDQKETLIFEELRDEFFQLLKDNEVEID